MRARGQITINAPDKNYSVALIPSVTQIGCNSFGTPDPSSFEVKFQRITEGVVTEDRAYLAVYGFDSSGSWVLLSGSEVNTKRSEVIVTVNMKYLQYTIKAHTTADPNFMDGALAVVSVNVVKNGDNTTSGTMLRNRGELKIGEKYYWNSEYRDMGYFPNGGVNEIYVVNKFSVDGYVTSSPPENCGTGKDWKKGNKSDFSAFDLVVIDDGYIENLVVGNLRTKGDTGSITINKDSNDIKIDGNNGKNEIRLGISNNGWSNLSVDIMNAIGNGICGSSVVLGGSAWINKTITDNNTTNPFNKSPLLDISMDGNGNQGSYDKIKGIRVTNKCTGTGVIPAIECRGAGIIIDPTYREGTIPDIKTYSRKKDNNVLHGVVAMAYIGTGSNSLYAQWASSIYSGLRLSIVNVSKGEGKTQVYINNSPFTSRDSYQVIATVNDDGPHVRYCGISEKVGDSFVVISGDDASPNNAAVFIIIIDTKGYF